MGVGYLAVPFGVQMVLSLIVGFLFCHPFAPTSPGQYFMLGLTLVLILTLGFYTLCGTANDLWDGVVTSVCFLLEAASIAFILASSMTMHADLAETSQGWRSLCYCPELLPWPVHVPAAVCPLPAASSGWLPWLSSRDAR